MAICLVMLPKSVLYDNSYNVCCNKYVKVMQSDKSKYMYAKKSVILYLAGQRNVLFKKKHSLSIHHIGSQWVRVNEF